MNRERKWRVWLDDEKDMVYTDNDDYEFFLDQKGTLWEWGYDPALGEYGLDLVGPMKGVVIMDWTGTQDVNGKDIYEGDIVETDGQRGKVFIDFYGCRIQKVCHCEEIKDKHYNYVNIYGLNVVVIGNRYQNPELLPE